ncbi:hypothetical protein CHOED_011 [Vibrio phage CHOED]|uniref:hypothetical protein n=1 Tax=Vibrio phage CHOED TaxID=1458716 RepID=UPI00042E5C71|nr:hypothetical protein CHOED_011 [Vibrio phage CHOED]AHK11871.1 hypothetical protein CHOED_011 [Vibrio phage CHOED]
MANKVKTIQVKRGTKAKSDVITHKLAEPIFTTDTKELYFGDGVTPGGIPVGTVKSTGVVVADMLALFKDSTGKLLYGLTKADFLQGYATEQHVTDAITNSVPTIKVNRATLADTATNAEKLKNREDWLNVDNLTASYQEDSTSKVVTAAGIKLMWDTINAGKIAVTSITSSLTDTSVTKVLSAAAGKALKDAQDIIKTTATSALSTANSALQKATANGVHLGKLPPSVTKGTAAPVNGTGVDGDVYLQYT